MPLRQFEYLLKIVENGSINQAAQGLGMDQQRLRGALNSLEKKLGFPILRRTKHGVTLTDKGQALWQDIVLVAGISQKWRENARPSDKTVSVRIAATAGLLTCVLNDVMALKKQEPHIAIDLLEAGFEDILPRILRDRMLGIIGSLALPRAEGYRALAVRHHMRMEELCRDDFCVILNARHPLAGRPTLRYGDLRELTPVMYPHAESNFQYGDLLAEFSGPTLHVSKLESILHLVAGAPNLATIFPASVLRCQAGDEPLAARPVEDFPMPALICLFLPDDNHIRPTERAVAAVLRANTLARLCPPQDGHAVAASEK